MDWSVNIWSVLIAAIATMILGFLWYGPFFGKAWMKLSGIKMPGKSEMKKAQKAMYKAMIIQFFGSLVAAYALGLIINNSGAMSVVEGVIIGLIVGIGVLAINALSTVLYEGRPVKLYFINISYNIASYAIMGAIITCPIWS